MSQEQSKDMSQYFYRASAADFMKIPGSPVAYWASSSVYLAFECQKIGEKYAARQGIATSDNDRFLRSWWEVSFNKFEKTAKSELDANNSPKKWFPYNKGGPYRKWYGNNESVVNWYHNGQEMKEFDRAVIRNPNYFFKPSVTWTRVSSSHFGARQSPPGFLFDATGPSIYPDKNEMALITALMCSKTSFHFLRYMSPTLDFQVGHIVNIPLPRNPNTFEDSSAKTLLYTYKLDWDSYESSWDFTFLPIIAHQSKENLHTSYAEISDDWKKTIEKAKQLEESNNCFFINAYGLQDEIISEVPLQEITLTCNPHYRYGANCSDKELKTLQQCDTLRELVSYAIGCMMGRYSLDKPGLILASQGETMQDYLQQIPSPRFAPDSDAILPLTDQEWFADDATNRFREFVRVVWGDEHLQENLDFVAESLCLHAIKPKRGESALDTIRRYLSTQFFKDHLRTYKKRPIYWLFSSGKHKAFECLVYLHRYNEGTLARMRTEYVIPLSAKLNSYAEKLEQDRDASTSAAETKRLSNELSTLHKQQAELAEFDEKLRHYADQRISLDLDDGVKVNYGKFGDLLAETKIIVGSSD